MNPQIRPVADIYAFNTLSLKLAMADLSEAQANHRWRQGKGSSIAYLVGHLLSTRYGLLKRLGKTEENPFAASFGDKAEPQDGHAYPPVAELLEAWMDVAAQLDAALQDLSDADLETPAEGLPITDRTTRGALMFMAWHESYHTGQIGLMRTELGLPSIQARFYEAAKH